MKQKHRRDREERPPARLACTNAGKNAANKPQVKSWPELPFRQLTMAGILLIALSMLVIYGQTISVPAIDYEDPFYLVHSPYVRVNAPFAGIGRVWDEPYFANFHPVTTTTWLLDRALSDKDRPFDVRLFRMSHLLYAVIGASLLITLYRRLGIPEVLAVVGALLFAVHPVHTEVVAWLSARKDLVSLVFILLSFLGWVRARDSETPNQWRLWYGLTTLVSVLAVLSKPVAVIVPVLFVAYEFCSAPHADVWRWRWPSRQDQPILTRVLSLTAIFVFVGFASALIFRKLLEKNPMHGGWLIYLLLASLLVMFGAAPSKPDLAAFREGHGHGLRLMAPPFVVLSAVFGAGSAWTLWAQEQVGAIKGGLTILPTLNLTSRVMLAYAAKTFVPAFMSASYSWNRYPYVSASGLAGAVLVSVGIWAAIRMSGAQDRNRRLIAFGIFWYLIALIPVSNLVPTSTQMADRYLFVPSVGAILAMLAVAGAYLSFSRRSQWLVITAFILVIALYTGWAHSRTEVWCGKTTPWNGQPQPDLSLWTQAVEANPDNTTALSFLGLTYLRLNPPDADAALLHLKRALQVSLENQGNIAGDRQLILTHVYSALGDGYFVKASQLIANEKATEIWREKKEAYRNAVKYFALASESPSGFASSDARVYGRLAEACEGQAQMDAQEAANATPDQRDALLSERNRLWTRSEEAIRHARETLIAGHVSSIDPDYREVILGEGNTIFGREGGASDNAEKSGYYRLALSRYQDAATLLPDDARPLLYQGLCYERLTRLEQSEDERQKEFRLAEAALRKALTLNVDSSDYSPALPYRALASLYADVGDYRSALDSLRSARGIEPAGPESAHMDQEIQSIEQYLAGPPTVQQSERQTAH